jgi:hypothetical protein
MVPEHDHQRIARDELRDILREDLEVVADGVKVGVPAIGEVGPASASDATVRAESRILWSSF